MYTYTKFHNPIHTPVEVTDSDDDRHLIIVLSKC